MEDTNKVRGYIEVYKASDRGLELMFGKAQTIDPTLFSFITYYLLNRTAVARSLSIDGITWGSYNTTTNLMVDGTYCGTFASGTSGNCTINQADTTSAKCSATFSFLVDKKMNYFEIGQGYQTPGANTQLIINRYAYDASLKDTGQSLLYQNGEKLIINWSLYFSA